MYTLEIKGRALRMMQEAYEWYEKQRTGLWEEFLKALDIAFGKIASYPQYFSSVYKQYCQVKIPRFPYVIVYEIMKKNVIVFAVFHTPKNPPPKIHLQKSTDKNKGQINYSWA